MNTKKLILLTITTVSLLLMAFLIITVGMNIGNFDNRASSIAIVGSQPSVTITSPNFEATKIAYKQFGDDQNATIAAMVRNGTITVPPAAPVQSAPTPTIKTGILPMRQNPYFKVAVISNLWIGDVDGVLLAVYAGGLKGDVNQGIVYITDATKSFGATDLNIQSFPTPNKDGSVEITSIDSTNKKLTLVSENGTVFTFDLRLRSFV